ncbi:MAG: PorP/SprF family type IX secretion system membrane protein [Bacteroidota bacterium]
MKICIKIISPFLRPFFGRVGAGIVAMMLCGTANAQDVHFSQFFEAPMLRNPALAGIFAGDFRVQAIYRHQWASVAVPYKTGSLNLDYKMPIGSASDFLTIGGQVVYDKAGISNFKTTQILPVINYHKSLSDEKNQYLSLGFMGGYVQRSIDPSKVTTDNQFTGAGYNPAMATGETLNYSLGYWDGSVGLSFNTGFGKEENENNNLFLGIAYHHFNRPKNSFYRNPGTELSAKWVYSFGLRFGMNERSYFTFHADYNKQGTFEEIIGGAMYTTALDDRLDNAQYKLGLGGFVRWKDAVIPVIKLEYKAMAVAFSYDVNTSLLKTASQGRGGFEISVTHTSFFDRENTTKNAVRCPRF